MFLRSVLVFFIATSSVAATIGSLPPIGSYYISRGDGGTTLMIIDVAHPATEAASLTTATVRWQSGPSGGCADAFKLKFLRPILNSGGFQVLAERGPFNVINGFGTNPLTPPVNVAAGDVVAIVQLLPVICGGMSFSNANSDRVYLSANLDPAVGATLTATSLNRGGIPCVRASNDTAVTTGYITVAGATAGGFGSQFKTSVQLSNPSDDTRAGRLVFHPAGAPASPSDPSVSYSLTPLQTISYDNIMETLGRTGLGSIDIVSTVSAPPLVTTRVFNDAGATGTSGFTEEVREVADAIERFDVAYLTIPSDLTNYRVNIGVRSLDAGATLSISMVNGAGSFAGGTFTRTYPANFFEQISLAQFVENTTLPPGGQVVVQVTNGSAIVYGTINDNRTNDPALKFFTRG